MLRIYNYDPDTGEFLGASDAPANPMEPGKHLVPANATPIAPPATVADGHVAAFDGAAWQALENNRGIVRWDAAGNARMMTGLGPFPPDWTDAPPAAPAPELTPEQELAARRAQQKCSKLQAKRVLAPLGLWAEFKLIAAADPEVQEDFDLAYELYRTDDFIAQAAAALSVPLSDAHLDVLFDLAVQEPRPTDAEIIAAFQAVQST